VLADVGRALCAGLAVGLLALGLVLTGCGRKAAPQPPVIRVADQTRDLAVYQESVGAVLSWSYPSATTAGAPLPDIEAIQVWRAQMPPAQEPQGTSPRDRQVQFQVLESRGKQILSLDPAALEQATRGSGLVIRDDLAEWYAENREAWPLVLWYAVRTVCCGGVESQYSNIVRLEPQLPPNPPQSVTAEPGAEGIVVRWLPVEGKVQVERSPDGQAWDAISSGSVSGGELVDSAAGQGRTWRYRLRSVTELEGGGRVLGEPSSLVEVDYRDVYPPPAPENLICLPEGELVRLRWQPVAEVAGYRVQRRVDNGAWSVVVDSQQELDFVDVQPPLGRLTYAVRAVDAAGNQSEPGECTTVMGRTG